MQRKGLLWRFQLPKVRVLFNSIIQFFILFLTFIGYGDCVRVFLASGSVVEDVKHINLALSRHLDTAVENDTSERFKNTRDVLSALQDYNVNIAMPLDAKGSSSSKVSFIYN